MIRCQECGQDNQIGTLFCHHCGAQLDVRYAQIQEGVVAGRISERDQKFLDAGRSAINLGVVAFLFASIFYFLLIPDMPPQSYPGFVPKPEKELFPGSEHWSGRIEVEQEDGGDEPSLEPDETFDLIAWRQSEADIALGNTAADLVGIYNHTAHIANQQDKSDYLWHTGDDVLAASGLALLAIEAYAYPVSIKRTTDDDSKLLVSLTEKGLTALKRRALDSSDTSLGRSLALMALVEGGVLNDDEVADARATFSSGDHPKWHSLALMTIPPDRRPKIIAALRREIQDPLWRHLLAPFSDKEIVPEVALELFDESFVKNLDPFDRVAWANVAWRYGIAPDLLNTRIKLWSQVDPPAQAPEELRRLAGGEVADRALAVLASSAPLRVPVTWLVANRADR